MKRLFVVLIYFAALQTTFAQTLSTGERKFLIDLLEENSKKFLTKIEQVSDEQWRFKPSSDKWSVGDIAEHITISEGFLFSIAQKLLQSLPDPEKAKNLEGNEQRILAKAMDRTTKAQAPEPIKPQGKFTSKFELIAAFKAAREKTITYIKTTSDPLKNHVAPHPAVGDLTAYQWLVWIVAHANRHDAQLEEVKANRNFPKI
ncbi:DinB family protein [Chryseolinea sp. H1M3-3]|uniref:DinB family protein n=1 Tax=Chryseolinea sp. H1M3-3 TaxID=3034144 RepID=UPI0023EBFAD6|nr:DinB family protein [Chryseolinea sp. H1M3-3]